MSSSDKTVRPFFPREEGERSEVKSELGELEGVKGELALLREFLRRTEADRFIRERQSAIDEHEQERTLLRMQQTLSQLAADLGAVREVTNKLAPQTTGGTGGLHRLSSTVRAARRNLFPRSVVFRAKPLHDVKALQDEGYNWLALARDPAFELVSTHGRFPYGWAKITFTFRSEDKKPARARLYLDGGKGFHESESVLLPRSRDGKVEALVLIPEGTRALRFDPTNRSGRFHLGEIRIHELGRYEAAVAMALPYARKAKEHPQWIAEALGNAVQLFSTGGIDEVSRRLREKALAGLDNSVDYADWIDAYDTLDDADRKAIQARIEALPLKPRMSVVMPVYNPPAKFLRRALDTVRSQIYQNWELCIADDASPNPEIATILGEYAQRDARIKYVIRKENGHISAASNTALQLATGELVVLMDHDDEIPEHALYFVLEEHNAHPEAGVIFSDEDKIDEAGARRDPYFKSDWNPDLFYSHNLISHLGVYKTSLVKEVGGFREGYEGSQDYDLALRITEKLPAEGIRHISRVLYHWRAIAGSTARGPDQKNYAEIAARRALQSHFDRIGSKAKIQPGPSGGLHRAVYPQPATPPLVSIIIPTRDGVLLLRRCIDSIVARTTYPNIEILVVDNGSVDRQTLAYLRQLQDHGTARVISYPGAFNYSAINNTAAETARGELLAFLNNDLEVINPDWLSEMVSHAVRPEIGAVGAKLYFPDDTIQHAGIIVGMGAHRVAGTPHRGAPRTALGPFGKAKLLQSIAAVTAACMVVRKKTFELVGGFNEEDFAVAFNDIDLCLRIGEAGLRILWTPYAELYHFESSSRGPEDTPEKRARFDREVEAMHARHHPVLSADPYYNPNLSLESDDFALAWPPRLRQPWRLEPDPMLSSAKRW